MQAGPCKHHQQSLKFSGDVCGSDMSNALQSDGSSLRLRLVHPRICVLAPVRLAGLHLSVSPPRRTT